MSVQLVSRDDRHWNVVIVCDGGCGYQTIPVVLDHVHRAAKADLSEESQSLVLQRELMRANAKRLRELEKDCDLVRRGAKHLCFSCEARDRPTIQPSLFDLGPTVPRQGEDSLRPRS